MELPGLCYGVRIESGCQTPLLELGCLAVFSKTEGAALEDIYAVGIQEEIPFIGKWMQKESLEGSASSRRNLWESRKALYGGTWSQVQRKIGLTRGITGPAARIILRMPTAQRPKPSQRRELLVSIL